MQASLSWAVAYGLLFCICLAWLAAFSARLGSSRLCGSGDLLRSLIIVHGPLLALSMVVSTAIYVSDEIHHVSMSFLYPTPAVALLLAVLATVVWQEGLIRSAPGGSVAALDFAASRARDLVLLLSLLLIGFLQGSSFIWVVGNDFTRYWAVADAIGTLAGYPASIHQQIYIRAGMNPYSIEFPVYPLMLLVSFGLLGHDTVGAQLPGLVANIALPPLLYALYRRVGLVRPLAYLASCLVVFFPFLRLYTLNAPVPDAVFIALLVATGCVFLHLVDQPLQPKAIWRRERAVAQEGRGGHGSMLDGSRSSWGADSGLCQSLSNRHWLPWLLFGVLSGLTTLTRAEGVVFVGVMFLGLVPHLFKRRLWVAVGTFLMIIVPFSLLMQATFGILWPRNAGNSFAFHHIAGNLDLLGRASLRWYAHAFGIPTSDFALVVGALAIASVIGTVWIAAERRPLALLPFAAWVHIILVFCIHPVVAGADQWFDFFRHLSYGLPFVVLPLFLLIGSAFNHLRRPDRGLRPTPCRAAPSEETNGDRGVPVSCGRPARSRSASGAPGYGLGRLLIAANLRLAVAYLALVLMLALPSYELWLLGRPSVTYGKGARQLLTSDIWVSLPDLLANRYPLPVLPFSPQRGVLMISPDFQYMPGHLRSVRAFFRPVSSLHTGRGSGYQLSSFLVMLLGFLFTFSNAPYRRGAVDKASEITAI